MSQKKPSVVITGSTRGIGLALAEAFLELGARVMISGRRQDTVDQVLAALADDHPGGGIYGRACDVRQVEPLRQLWDAARDTFGSVDFWVNNAGLSHSSKPLWELEATQVAAVIDTNISGALFGSMVAIAGMLRQGHGQLFNLEGLGSVGPVISGTAVYAASKAAITSLNRTLVKEVKGTPVLVGTILPGMVITDLLLGPESERQGRFGQGRLFLDIFAEKPETVGPYLAKRVLKNRRSGARIAWPTNRRGLAHLPMALLGRRKVLL